MTWWQFSVSCQASELEDVENLMLENGALSLSLTDAGDEPIYEPLPGYSPVWRESIVTATFEGSVNAEALYQQLSAAMPAHLVASLRFEPLPDQDWDLAYRQHLKPLQFAPNLWVVPSWLEPPDPDATVIRLDPGIAFGTGGHSTTALCLGWLADHPLSDCKIIDYGCGSGILAIAACKLGADRVLAVDIDPQAVSACDSNRIINNIPDHQIDICLPDDMQDFESDLLIANILARPLVGLAPRFASLVRSGGQILLSGILKTQLKEIQSAYSPFFNLDAERTDEDWISISGKRT
jgi:ribosomal protein L11 methyltransferase